MRMQGLLAPLWARLGAAVVLVAIGAALRATLFAGLGDNVRFAPFYLMVILAAFLGGLAAGLLATALSVVVTELWLHTDATTFDEWWSVAAFVTIGVIVSVIAEHRRRASETLEREKARAQSAEAKASYLNAELERRVALRTRELKKANEELEAFAYTVSHDLRAPLRTLDGFSQILLEDYGERLDEENRSYLKRIRAADAHMGEIIDALLSLSRINSHELRREPVDLSQLAREIGGELAEAEAERKVRLVVAERLEAHADRDLASILLTNLLGNAWKFTAKREAARIEVGAQPIDGEQAFFVRDNGVGFDVAYADKLFRAFERLHGEDGYEGLGIGLATVKRVAERHGGRVWAEGLAESGATFFFTLPDPEDSHIEPALVASWSSASD